LALTVTDLDEDGHPDVGVGNDFAVPDMIWYRRGRGWAPRRPSALICSATTCRFWSSPMPLSLIVAALFAQPPKPFASERPEPKSDKISEEWLAEKPLSNPKRARIIGT